MRNLKRSKRADKFLDSLPTKQFVQVDNKTQELRKNPLPHDSIKLFSDLDEIYYRVDVGEYRVIYCFNSELVHVVMIGKRNDGEVYKKFLRYIS